MKSVIEPKRVQDDLFALIDLTVPSKADQGTFYAEENGVDSSILQSMSL